MQNTTHNAALIGNEILGYAIATLTGTLQYGVTDGYWILLSPLPPGPHTIFIRGVIDFGGGNTFEVEVTYNLTVGL